MLFTLWSVCVLGPAIVLEFSSLSNAKPTIPSPCSKCKEFDVKNDEHSLCSFGCSSSYTLKTNIPENSDNRNEALIALANKLLPLLREFKKNVHPKRRKLQSFLNEGIGRNQWEDKARKVEIIVQDDNLSSFPSSGSGSSSSSFENMEQKLFRSHNNNHHHNQHQDLPPSAEDDRTLRRLVRIDPPRRRKVKQEERMNEELSEGSDNFFNSHENPLFPAQRKQYENNNNNNNNKNKNHRLFHEMPSGRIQPPNPAWDDNIFTLDERVKNKLRGVPTNRNYGFADPAESESEDFNEIPEETVDQSNKNKIRIRPNPNKKNKPKLPNPELEMFSNEDSFVLESKRVKKD